MSEIDVKALGQLAQNPQQPAVSEQSKVNVDLNCPYCKGSAQRIVTDVTNNVKVNYGICTMCNGTGKNLKLLNEQK